MGKSAEYYGPPSNLSDEEVDRLWAAFAREHTQELRDRLIDHYMILVYQTAERMASRLPDHVNINDLIGWGALGLIDAINRFEHDRGIKFATYCCSRISGQILDELRRLDWIPRLVRVRVHQLARAREDLTCRLGRTPDDEEIAGELGLGMDQYDEFVRETRIKNIVSLNRKHDDEDENELGQIEMLPDVTATNPLTELQRAEIKEVAIRGLSDKQKQVLVMYYFDNLSLKEIGDLLGLSESRVCQIHAQVLEFLKEKFNERQLTHVQ